MTEKMHNSRLKWCHGQRGVHHKLTIFLPPDVPDWQRKECHWYEDNPGDWVWHCNHYGICDECGKNVYRIPEEKCPEFTDDLI